MFYMAVPSASSSDRITPVMPRICTDQAVKQFQKANGLDVDGIVGGDTWRVLTGAA